MTFTFGDYIFTNGDDASIKITLKKGPEGSEVAEPVDSGATVDARVLDLDDLELITWQSVLEATLGSDWANGKIVATFTAAQTGAIAALTTVKIVVRVTDGGDVEHFWSKEFLVR